MTPVADYCHSAGLVLQENWKFAQESEDMDLLYLKKYHICGLKGKLYIPNAKHVWLSD